MYIVSIKTRLKGRQQMPIDDRTPHLYQLAEDALKYFWNQPEPKDGSPMTPRHAVAEALRKRKIYTTTGMTAFLPELRRLDSRWKGAPLDWVEHHGNVLAYPTVHRDVVDLVTDHLMANPYIAPETKRRRKQYAKSRKWRTLRRRFHLDRIR